MIPGNLFLVCMKEIYLPTRAAWRKWLRDNHDREEKGIWLVFYKKGSGKPSLDYEESVEEALCFGWIDSIIKRIDEERYCRKFTPRKETSAWSPTNRRRAEKIIRDKRMTTFGLAKIMAAKKLGRWEMDTRPGIDLEIPRELSKALERDKQAKEFFAQMAPTHQNHFIGWITTAKRPETRERRLKESLALLKRGKRLGLK